MYSDVVDNVVVAGLPRLPEREQAHAEDPDQADELAGGDVGTGQVDIAANVSASDVLTSFGSVVALASPEECAQLRRSVTTRR